MDEKDNVAWHTVVTTVDGQPHVQRVGAGHKVEGADCIILEAPHGVPVIIRTLHPDAGTPARVVWVDGSVADDSRASAKVSAED